MAIRHPQAVQRLSGSPATAESRPGTIGRISLGSRSKQESAVREIRMLRSTRRGLETWHGRDAVTLANERARERGTQTSTYTGAPVPDPTCERPVVKFPGSTQQTAKFCNALISSGLPPS